MCMESGRTKNIAFSLALVAVFVLAASAGFASEGGEGAHHADHAAAQMKDFGWRVFDFAVLVAILVWALKKANVKGSLADRQIQIEKSLKEAELGREAAEAKLRDYSARLDQAAKEIDEIRAAIVREAEQEKDRIIAEAEKAAARIVSQAALSAEQETVKARGQLRAEAGRLAVELAGSKLTAAITKGDHDRFVGEYLDKVVQIQ
jgi:F-type H+-transporting ATPase subunit b